MRDLERQILLQIIDNRWREHLYEMDYLREGIHLRGFAQIDPLVAYKNEGFSMFRELMDSIWEEFARVIFHVEVNVEPAQAQQLFGRARTAPPAASGVLGRRARAAVGDARRRRAPASGRRESPAAPHRRAPAAAGRPPATAGAPTRQPGHGGQGRAREDRPQRPLLVRLGQEVQEVPRRLSRASPLAAAAAALTSRTPRSGAGRLGEADTVTISGKAYRFNHSRDIVSRARRSASASCRSSPRSPTPTATTSSTVPDDTTVTPYIEPRPATTRSTCRPSTPAARTSRTPTSRPRTTTSTTALAAPALGCRSGRTAGRALRRRQHCVGAQRAGGRLRDLPGAHAARRRRGDVARLSGGAGADLLQRERDPRPVADRDLGGRRDDLDRGLGRAYRFVAAHPGRPASPASSPPASPAAS